jgi:hypothetical protein
VSHSIYCYSDCHYDECHYDECHYDECHYDECHYDECHYDECRCVVKNVKFNVGLSFGKNTCEGCMSMLAFQHCPRSQGKYKQLLLPAFCCLRFCHNILLMKMPLKTYQFVVLFVNDGEVGQAESAGMHKNKYWL